MFGEQIASGLRDRGWDVEFRALVRDDGPSVEATPLVDKDRSELGTIDVSVIRALGKTIGSFRPDIVFANGGATLPVSVVATELRRRTLAYGSIGEPLYWARSDRARKRTSFFLRRCDAVFAISRPTRRQLVEGLGVASDRAVVAHPGVGESFFEIASTASATMRVLFLGSLSPEKGPLAALTAFERAAERAAMEMRFVGGGPLLDELRGEAGDAVTVVGPVPDVREQLAWADVLVLASETEGMPGAVLEAGAAGVPTVAFDVGGVSDVVTNATGRLVDRADVDGMADALVELAGDSGARAALGSAVRDVVRSQFTLKASMDRYDDILRALHEGRPLPTGDH